MLGPSRVWRKRFSPRRTRWRATRAPQACHMRFAYATISMRRLSYLTGRLRMLTQDFATLLRWWRRRRGWSQLELAGRAAISQRHLGFLELCRASPSRDMVVRLATALNVPLRQHNALLLAAGYAPLWQERDLAAPDLAQVREALSYMLTQQEPFPAVVV